MKKYISYIVILLICLIPFNVFGLSNEYVDKVKDIVNVKVDTNKVYIYFFHSNTCPHCEEESKYLKELLVNYDDVVLMSYEVHDSNNYKYMESAKKLFDITSTGVPYTVIGNKYYLGYDSYVGNSIKKDIDNYLSEEITEKEVINDDNTMGFSLFDKEIKFNAKDVSIPIMAIIFGLIDGFNPCAMWVLIFLISMFIGMNNKKRMFIYGFCFLLTSSFIYFLSMLGINIVFDFINTSMLQKLIGLVALVAGIYNIYVFIKTRKDDGCHVIDKDKRKSIFKKTDKIINSDKFIIGLLGIISLGITVNLVELACTAVFPALFDSVLSLNNIRGITRIIYLLLYILFYMLDDLIVFIIAMKTLSIKGISTKYNKYIHLISGIIMIIMCILLIFKPEIIMMNF